MAEWGFLDAETGKILSFSYFFQIIKSKNYQNTHLCILSLQGMNKASILSNTEKFVRQRMMTAEGGHDWWHVFRVWKTARKIAEKENVDLFVVELAALLHDIADPKFHDGNEEIGPDTARVFLEGQRVEPEITDHVVNIIKNMSFKNSLGEVRFHSKEMDVVQDADRLDAIGAIGIARAFNYGGFKNRPLFDPDIKPSLFMTKEEYKQGTSPTVNHFYEKLLLLKDKMNTKTGKDLAQQRHVFMEQFLLQFFEEWGGNESFK